MMEVSVAWCIESVLFIQICPSYDLFMFTLINGRRLVFKETVWFVDMDKTSSSTA